MQKTQIIAPEWANSRSDPTWHATYKVTCSDHSRHIAIDSRSAIDLVVVKIVNHTPDAITVAQVLRELGDF